MEHAPALPRGTGPIVVKPIAPTTVPHPTAFVSTELANAGMLGPVHPVAHVR